MTRLVCDVLIIGAGVLGCSTAFHLAKQRGARVIVFEKGSVAAGATKRSGALIHAHHTDETTARLAHASWKYFQNWQEITGTSCGFAKTGLIVTAGQADETKLRGEVEKLSKIGVTRIIISPAELKELQPHAHIDDIAIAAHEPDAGYVDAIAATTTLATRAKELGVKFKTGTLVKNIRVQMNRVFGVDTTIGEIDALTVIVTAGVWTDRLLKPLGVQIGTQSMRAQVAFFDRPPELKAGHAAFIDYITGAHFRPHTFGLTMVGLNAPASAETNPDAFDENVPGDFVNDARQRLAARLPAMAQARYVRGHAGIYDVAPDNRPVISRVPGIAGLIVAAGFGGIGFAVAPAVGACVAEMITDGEARTVDVRKLEIRN